MMIIMMMMKNGDDVGNDDDHNNVIVVVDDHTGNRPFRLCMQIAQFAIPREFLSLYQSVNLAT